MICVAQQILTEKRASMSDPQANQPDSCGNTLDHPAIRWRDAGGH
jgi:hypothetical protein